MDLTEMMYCPTSSQIVKASTTLMLGLTLGMIILATS